VRHDVLSRVFAERQAGEGAGGGSPGASPVAIGIPAPLQSEYEPG
jgi:hypothetical protein